MSTKPTNHPAPSDTPRTEEFYTKLDANPELDDDGWTEGMRNFARQLERELAEAKKDHLFSQRELPKVTAERDQLRAEVERLKQERDLWLGTTERIKVALRQPGLGSYVEWAKECRDAYDQLTTLRAAADKREEDVREFRRELSAPLGVTMADDAVAYVEAAKKLRAAAEQARGALEEAVAAFDRIDADPESRVGMASTSCDSALTALSAALDAKQSTPPTP